MPRKPSHTPESLADSALAQFWYGGYEATSMDTLVKKTGVSRHGIYTDYGSKRSLYLACFPRYHEHVVAPVLNPVFSSHDGLPAITAYFGRLIEMAEGIGLPGPGCFVANAATETAPHDPDVARKVSEHNTKLENAFTMALQREKKSQLPLAHRKALARIIAMFSAALWTSSRSTDNPETLRQHTAVFLDMLENRVK
ncbi:putative tetR-family transcriptional regulator [Pseudooceanicola batsensis HTCC2597]|uniref:Putative tetR-family transcriptional regulator n=1 Tax=Pseudooceanicola batsensis (strain ATCC BAA-863 / DSM 15984 / KCTC 12145 / HTCC2597) TaxID=252305 RepID=A3U414_PSEBH|nr:TetR/AcrR family transcriptional regulator [Pseudooceanicola batsensis]EAQ01061.1 putative tetR-family transcriptional regulator [Pseudooceanicola batsensis HTCC2597]